MGFVFLASIVLIFVSILYTVTHPIEVAEILLRIYRGGFTKKILPKDLVPFARKLNRKQTNRMIQATIKKIEPGPYDKYGGYEAYLNKYY